LQFGLPYADPFGEFSIDIIRQGGKKIVVSNLILTITKDKINLTASQSCYNKKSESSCSAYMVLHDIAI
jgi:hypothetical protein